MDLRVGWLDEVHAKTLYCAVWNGLQTVHDSVPVEYCFVWNGSRVPGCAIDTFCRRNGISIRFFEIGNFPGKLFVDPQGVNARSSLMRGLPAYPADRQLLQDFALWKKDYISYKERQPLVPQSLTLKRINWLYAMDYLGERLLGIPANDNLGFRKKVVRQAQRHASIKLDLAMNIPAGPFMLMALQTNQDSQILLNSPINQLQAIARARDIASEKGMPLILRPHPAETDHAFLLRLADLQQDDSLIFSDAPTFELLKKCSAVVVINSTVGLEAKIMGKKTYILGRCFYEGFTESDLAFYIMCYLLNYDYFKLSNREAKLPERILGMPGA